MTLLTVTGLTKRYPSRRTVGQWLSGQPAPRLTALDDLSISLEPNEVLGIVGESGSGKSTIARCIVGLEKPDAGTIAFDGIDVWQADRATLRGVRRRMQMIYQDPYGSLNPRHTIGRTISEPAIVHNLVERGGVDTLVHDLLGRVGLPRSVATLRPRALSGGQRQRVAIARALALQPQVIVADEAVSALDVSIQAQILNLFGDLVRDLGLSMIFISHQLSVVAHLSTRVAVMYLGRVVETGRTADVFARPRHPYTAALLKAHPRVEAERAPAPALTGEIPSAYRVPAGCRFNTRCAYAQARCFSEEPPETTNADGHRAWCHVLPALDGVAESHSPRRETCIR